MIFFAISFQNIANLLTNLIAISFHIITNICTTLFWRYCLKLIAKTIIYYCYIFSNYHQYSYNPYLSKKSNQTYCKNNTLLLKGSINSFLLLTIKHKTNWGNNYNLLEPHSPNNNRLLTLEACFGSFNLKLFLCLWHNHLSITCPCIFHHFHCTLLLLLHFYYICQAPQKQSSPHQTDWNLWGSLFW